jgi:hypothetical protein
MTKKNCGKDEPSCSRNRKSSRNDEPNTRGWVTCGTCGDGTVIQVGAIAREFEVVARLSKLCSNAGG